MSGIVDFLQNHPFVFGLLVGLSIAVAAWGRGVLQVRDRQREIKRLKELLHTKLEIEAESQQALSEQLKGLRTQNENLRITVNALQQKPDRADLRTLHVYDRALRTLLARSPGFGPAWQSVLEEAEQEMANKESGLGAFVRRVLSPRTVRALPEKSESKDDDSSGS